jgi:hypothetical protein
VIYHDLRKRFCVWHGQHRLVGITSSSGTENRAKVFSLLNTWSDFLTVAVIPALLATPSAALGDSVSSASVAARPTHGDDVLEDHGGSILCPRAGHSSPS